MKNSKELPRDRLATSDQEGKRIYLYPTDVKGRFKTYRTITHYFLILILLVLPWIKINGYQSILLNLPKRQFAVFGITFWAHDAPMLLFVFGGAAIALAFVTALWGRVWCGWACPQTVFIETVFRFIERLVEGDAIARRTLNSQNFNLDKFLKKSVKWSAFTFFTLIISHSFLAYFIGTETLASIIRKPPSENLSSFIFMASITSLLLFNFGWFREQFCTLVCPYGRFQSLLMDNHSLIIAYDEKRGEPRKGTEPAQQYVGDCVNCYRCVQVCPTGIDIRRGVQLECIACAACIDACDDVMTRLKKPIGLIRYATEESLKQKITRFIRPRTIIYFFLVLGVMSGLISNIASRSPVEMLFVRPGDLPYQEIKDQSGSALIINHFKVEFSNQTFRPLNLKLIAITDNAFAPIEIVSQLNSFNVGEGKRFSADLFLKFPKAILNNGRAKIKLRAIESESSEEKSLALEEVVLVGPYL